MRFYEFAPTKQPSTKPAPVVATDVKGGRMRRAIAQSATKMTPSDDDLAIAFTPYGQAQRAADQASKQQGAYKAKPFTG